MLESIAVSNCRNTWRDEIMLSGLISKIILYGLSQVVPIAAASVRRQGLLLRPRKQVSKIRLQSPRSPYLPLSIRLILLCH